MPERLYRLRDELLDRGGVADVGRNHDRNAPVARELVRERPERGLIAGSKGHRGPRRPECPGGFRPDPAAGSRDDGDLPGEKIR
jgi:hypothetical protein